MSSAIKIIHGDCLEELKKLEDNSVDAVVTDPPYGLSNMKPAQVADVLKAWVTGDTEAVPTKKGGFMGKDWDSFVPPPAVWEECMRVLKPGGHMAVFAGARTQDLMGLSIRLAGFEIRDTLGWIYGSGFPKSMDVSKAIDKKLGAEREVKLLPSAATAYAASAGNHRPWMDEAAENGGMRAVAGDTPATPEAEQWDGWGTALKPAIEPIILARKPLDGTVAANVLAHGVGGLNIDACRVAHDEPEKHAKRVAPKFSGTAYNGGKVGGKNNILSSPSPAGRFPANVLLDEHAAKEMDKQSGVSASIQRTGKRSGKSKDILGDFVGQENVTMGHNDSGGASRFFPVFKYQAKAPKRERPVIEREDGTKIQHPTVKPLELMEWLVTLITPPGGVVLNPFSGSGTTLQAAKNEGFKVIGIEQDADYIKLINQRLNR